jgi:hypothetical protein
MLVEEALYSLLTADAEVSAIVGTRVFPGVAPQDVAAPYVLYRKTGRDRRFLPCGTDGTMVTSFQIDCYAATYLQSVQLAQAVTDRLEPYRGATGSPAITLVHWFLDREFDLSDIEPGLFRQSCDWRVWHHD